MAGDSVVAYRERSRAAKPRECVSPRVFALICSASSIVRSLRQNRQVRKLMQDRQRRIKQQHYIKMLERKIAKMRGK